MKKKNQFTKSKSANFVRATTTTKNNSSCSAELVHVRPPDPVYVAVLADKHFLLEAARRNFPWAKGRREVS